MTALFNGGYMRKIFLTALSCALLIGCSSANNVSKIPTDVKGMVFNNVASTYMERPTSAYLVDYPNGNQSIEYVVETYRMNNGLGANLTLKIPSEHASEHLSILNKFLEWDKLAKSRNDSFSKEIGIAPTTNGYNVYAFHSGNNNTNVLVSCFSLTNTPGCGIEEAVFTVDNVKKIIRDVNKLKTGSLKPVDTSIYN
jgi:hypothetical protein